ncbi:MAG TPA: cbb3-type cytochrome c oxidase subunit 3 [Hyphomicrobiaceae bacterium]|nr:cbb3-type cytochrome c oxidase subunit 3 [Hyphomicrobiaceae bacterium]
MSYDTVATFSQVTSLLIFIVLFAGVLAYAFWPRNRARFEAAQRRALGLDWKPAADSERGRR